MTMPTMITLNKTVTLPILLYDDQTEYVSLTQDTTIMILLHKSVFISVEHQTTCTPIGHLQVAIGMKMMC